MAENPGAGGAFNEYMLHRRRGMATWLDVDTFEEATAGHEDEEKALFVELGGAQFYYLRAVLHGWPDDKCRLTLRNIVAAMGPESVILVVEMVLPDANVHWHPTQPDLTVMAALASQERTPTERTELLASVGLKIVNTYIYTPSIYESVMHVVRKRVGSSYDALSWCIFRKLKCDFRPDL
ncbi:MAG: hypothetical protein Q9184_006814 [Pyrenodesmia sp. 2 TL-2023]